MGIIKLTGVVLQENDLGDADKMVTLLTPNYGKIGCSAKGARRPRNTLMAGTQFLCFGEFMVYKGTNTYKINSVEPIEFFYNIRTDLEKLEYATRITKIIKDVTDENQNTYRILQLYLNTMYVISETDMDLDFVYSIFKLRLLCILGYSPKVKSCVCCGEENDLKVFSILENGFKCGSCGKVDKSTITILEATKSAIQYIVMAPPKKIFSFNLGEESKKELKLITKLFLNEKLEKEYF